VDGIPRGHSFAVLDVKREGDARQVLLRNPWGDEEGFWIDLDEMPALFQGLSVNWNTKLFSHISHHQCTTSAGNKEDTYGFSRNMQFYFKTENMKPNTIIWIVVSRLMNSVAQLESVENALACHAFAGNKRVELPDARDALFTGSYASGPHTLCRIEKASTDEFVIVLSAYAATKPVPCTISLFSTSVILETKELPPVLPGGSIARSSSCDPWNGNGLRAAENPLWLVKLPVIPALNARIKMMCIAPSKVCLEFWLMDVKAAKRFLLSSSDYRNDFCLIDAVIPGDYLSRTSIRYLLIPKFAALSDANQKQLDYQIEVQYEYRGLSLVPPKDEKQQGFLQKLLDQYTVAAF